MEMSTRSDLTIYFSENFILQRPESITPEVLFVSLIKNTDYPDETYGFSWVATEFTHRKLVLHLTFDKPLWISSQGQHNLDVVNVQVRNPFKFRSQADDTLIQRGQVLAAEIPFQSTYGFLGLTGSGELSV